MEETVGPCIESLLALDYPKDRMEVIVVDNGSTDQTRAVVGRYPVVSLQEQKKGSAAARNTGVAVAQGEIIAFTDADCVVDTDWATEIDRSLKDASVDAVMGYAGGINANVWSWLEQWNFEEFWYHRNEDGYSLKRNGLDTRNCAIRRAVLEQLGHMNSDLLNCGDLEIGTRLRASGREIAFNQEMKVLHHNRTELEPILQRKRNHARAYLQIVQGLPDGFDSRFLPTDFSTFLGVDNRSIAGLRLSAALLGLRALRPPMILALKALALPTSRPSTIAGKLFKTLCAVTWEIAILEDKRRQQA